MSKEVNFLEAAKTVEKLKEELEVAYEKLNSSMVELGLNTYVQDSETRLVYKVVKPGGRFMKFSDIDYVRTAKEGERAGTLSKKEAQEKGFNL